MIKLKKPHTKIKDLLRGKQSGFALPIAILIAVILIVAGGAGYYFYLSRDEVLRDKTPQKQKEISCTTNSDCGADACHQERHVCFEVRYVCENGKCSSVSKEYANYSCAKDYYGSINFTGGTILEVEYKKIRPEIQIIAEKLADLFESISIQPTGEKGIILKMKHVDEVTHQQVLQRLGEVEEKYFESVRGTIDYSKCMDTCGDDICRLPETKDWCPEDCKEVKCLDMGQVVSPSLPPEYSNIDKKCCEGLKLIRTKDQFDENCNFILMVGAGSVCTPCGNGICDEKYENACNCPDDCLQSYELIKKYAPECIEAGATTPDECAKFYFEKMHSVPPPQIKGESPSPPPLPE